jgi:phosphomannomutase/phosphoglucomutase
MTSDSPFRAYDIRGVVGQTLTEELVYRIGRAFASEAEAQGQRAVVVGADGRQSSPGLKDALIRGLVAGGRLVTDIGTVSTPLLYYAACEQANGTGMMITGSHNPPEYNGIKMMLAAETLAGEAIQALRRRVEAQDFISGQGQVGHRDCLAGYVRRIAEQISPRIATSGQGKGKGQGKALRIVVDAGNGVAGPVAPRILTEIGQEVVEIFCDVDGSFPNHHPDPSQPENLQDLIARVLAEGAALGLAFDGDGDRLGVVDHRGRILWPDRLMMLYARQILAAHPGAEVIFDVKCSRHLADDIAAHGGQPVMWRTGHSFLKARLRASPTALLAGEMSGHLFFKDRWNGMDDACYAAARLVEILQQAGRPLADLVDELPGGVSTPELRVPLPEGRHAEFMAALCAAARFPDGQTVTMDGLRVDFPDGFGLVRASNTSPNLTLRFEGDDGAALARIQSLFRQALLAVDSGLTLPI